MPKLWSDTVQAHRHGVRKAILDAAGRLVTTEGLLSVTMSRIAADAGIGRATLYKYFPDVETILHAWHESHVETHLDRLTELASTNKAPGVRLEVVLREYARICHARSQHGTADLTALLHRTEATAGAERRLFQLFSEVMSDAAEAHEIRDDVSPDELAAYSLHALTTAHRARTPAAVSRVVELTLTAVMATPSAAGSTSHTAELTK